MHEPKVRCTSANLHFSLHLQPLEPPGMCVVYNFERLRFCSLPTSSQESVKHKSTFSFTFTLRTIYEVNDTATWVLGVVFFHRVSSHLFQSTSPTPPPQPHSLYFHSRFLEFLLFSFFVHFINPSTDGLIHWSIHPSIIQSIYPLIDLSIDWSIDQSIDQCIER